MDIILETLWKLQKQQSGKKQQDLSGPGEYFSVRWLID